jgi:hypothetical protein
MAREIPKMSLEQVEVALPFGEGSSVEEKEKSSVEERKNGRTEEPAKGGKKEGFYLSQEASELLRREWLKGMNAGQKVNKSQLVSRAIMQVYGGEG